MLKPRSICAVLILGIAGFVSASALVGGARAQDPAPTEPVTTVAPEPAPDPAPPLRPRPTPAPKPKPAAPAPPRRVTVTPRTQRTPQPTPPVVQSEPSTPSTRRVVKPKPKPKPKPKKAVRRSVRVETNAAVAGAEITRGLKPRLPVVAAATPDDPVDLAAALIIVTLALAIACFGITSIPRHLLPGRAMYFVVGHQVELVVAGVGLLALTLFTFLWAGSG